MAEDVTLPPMLQPIWREMRPLNTPKVAAEWFSREQMAEYATKAVLADREARDGAG